MEIRNERLTVTFRDEPESMHPHHRFETIGVVEQVTLDGTHVFCEPEQQIPERVTCDGVGLCGEYGFGAPGTEAAAGEYYPKIGVGLLLQTEDHAAYNCWKTHECREFSVTVTAEEDRAVFVQEPIPCNGYAVRITKVMSLEDNALVSEVTMENVGTRAVELSEYQHNFVSIDGEPIGPGYELAVPFVKTLKRVEGCVTRLHDEEPKEALTDVLHVAGDTIIFDRKKSEENGLTQYTAFKADELDCAGGRNYWKLTHRGLGVSVSETFDFAPSMIAIWGIEHCICTEVFKPIELAPGEVTMWRRTWRFESAEE